MSRILRNPILWGVMLSATVLALVVWLAGLRDENGVSAYTRFLALDPNAMGDTLAGIFASLAFIWIVVTVFLQSAELREQREVLKAQRLEFEQMAEAQKAQVDALRAQAEIFLDEQKDRHEKRSERLFLAQFASIKSKMLEISEPGGLWEFERDGRINSFGIGDHQYKAKLRNLEGGEFVESILMVLGHALDTLRIIETRDELKFFPGRPLLEALEEKIIDLQQIDGLSEASRIVLSDYRFERILDILKELLAISSGFPERRP